MNTQTTGSKIKQLRKSKGLTQKQLGDIVGVTFQQIQKYEKGVNNISIERLKKISQILDVTIYDLLTPSDNNSSNEDNSYYAEKIMYFMNKMKTNEERQKIVEMVGLMVG